MGERHDPVDWKDHGVKVIPGDQLDPNTAQTPGMNRAAAINFARVGAQKIWAGTVTIHPNAKTGAHHHGALESVIYVRQGPRPDALGRAARICRRGRPGRLHLRAALCAAPGDQRLDRRDRSNACWCAATTRRSSSTSTSSRSRSRKSPLGRPDPQAAERLSKRSACFPARIVGFEPAKCRLAGRAFQKSMLSPGTVFLHDNSPAGGRSLLFAGPREVLTTRMSSRSGGAYRARRDGARRWRLCRRLPVLRAGPQLSRRNCRRFSRTRRPFRSSGSASSIGRARCPAMKPDNGWTSRRAVRRRTISRARFFDDAGRPMAPPSAGQRTISRRATSIRSTSPSGRASTLDGDPVALYRGLCRNQPVAHGALIATGDHTILSLLAGALHREPGGPDRDAADEGHGTARADAGGGRGASPRHSAPPRSRGPKI